MFPPFICECPPHNNLLLPRADLSARPDELARAVAEREKEVEDYVHEEVQVHESVEEKQEPGL